MNEFMVENNSVEPVAPVLIAAPKDALPPGVRMVPVEDLGLGVVRLIKGGVLSVAALSKNDSLATAAKKASNDIVGVVKQAKQKVTGLLAPKDKAGVE